MKLNEILRCVDEEPEFPGPPPRELREALQKALYEKDADLIVECLRIVVRLTKQGIAERIKAATDGEGGVNERKYPHI
jgi:hypothetical protein